MKKTCCECRSALLWCCEELLCVVKDKFVDGNDLACEEFKEKPKKVKNKDKEGESEFMSPKASQNTERISVFISKETLDLLKDAASKRGTNVSSLSRFIIIQWLLQQDALERAVYVYMNNADAHTIQSIMKQYNLYSDFNHLKFVDEEK